MEKLLGAADGLISASSFFLPNFLVCLGGFCSVVFFSVLPF